MEIRVKGVVFVTDRLIYLKLPVPDGNVSIMMEELLRLLPTLVSKYIDTE